MVKSDGEVRMKKQNLVFAVLFALIVGGLFREGYAQKKPVLDQRRILSKSLEGVRKFDVADDSGCRRVHFNCSCLRDGDGGENTFGYGAGAIDLGQCTSINWLSWHYINNPREACAEKWNPSDPDALIYQKDVKCNVCWRCLEYCTLK